MQNAAGELLKAAKHGTVFLFTARIAVSRAVFGVTEPPIGAAPRLKKRDKWKALRKR